MPPDALQQGGIRTLDELLALPARRELDTEVAKSYGIMRGRFLDDEYVIPHYSTTWACAEVLLDEMLAAGVSITLFASPGGLAIISESHPIINLDVPTLAAKPLAIVRAWLTWKLGKEQVT